MKTNSLPFRAANRPAPRKRLIKAFGHFRKLMADKEDTAQVFHMVDCLPSRRYEKQATAFCASAAGAQLMAIDSDLALFLDDHATLLAMPVGSVGHAYVAFMRAEGLSAAGLIAEQEKAGRARYVDQMQWMSDRLRDTHDLHHVLTGYGRDALGEQCVLGFSGRQYHGLMDNFLSWAGALELKRRVKSPAPVLSAVREAKRNGSAAQRIFAQNIKQLLAEPLDAARARLGIAPPAQYQAAHATYRSAGIDPYNFLASREARLA
jgi:ubiquinone biosynthesis protein COQ4